VWPRTAKYEMLVVLEEAILVRAGELLSRVAKQLVSYIYVISYRGLQLRLAYTLDPRWTFQLEP
jgi:hypothetical protein